MDATMKEQEISSILQANYDLPELCLRHEDIGLMPKQVWLMDLSTGIDEALLQIAIQGLCNRFAPMVWLDHTPVKWGVSDQAWRDYYHETQGYEFINLKTDLGRFLSATAPVFNGIILYDQDIKTEQTLLALNLASLNGCLPVNLRTYEAYRRAFGDLPIIARIKREAFSFDEIWDWMLDEVFPLCDRKMAMSDRFFESKPEHGPYQSMDYAFYRKSFMFNLADEDTITPENDRRVRRIMGGLDRIAFVMGWGDHEGSFCQRLSQYGHTWCASVAAPNLSFHAGVKPITPPPYHQDMEPTLLRAEPKVYIAFMSNEGDTCTVLTQMTYGEWLLPGRGKVPFNWAINPIYCKLFPAGMEYYFRTRTPNDYILPAPSGAGYHYPQDFPLEYYEDLTRFTAELQREAYDFREIQFWGGDSRPAMECLARNLHNLRGLSIQTPVTPGIRIGENGKSVPVLGHLPETNYWICRKEFMQHGKMQMENMLAFLDNLYAEGPLPRFVLFYGSGIDEIAKLNERLDPGRFQIINHATMFHLAASQPVAENTQRVVPKEHDWDDNLPLRPEAWSARCTDGINMLPCMPVLIRQPNGLRFEISPGQSWASAAIPGVQIPPNAKGVRVRIAENPRHIPYSMYILTDFLGFGGEELSEVFKYQKAFTTEALFSEMVLPRLTEPLSKIRFDVFGKPGDYLVIEGMDIIT